MLDVHRLVLLRAVAMHGSITAAARELGYSHSAVSQQLALLERETASKLVEKAGRTVRLTPVGLDLVRNTEAVLAALEHAETELAASMEQPRGSVTVAVYSSLGRLVMPAALQALHRDFPRLEVRVRRLDPQEAVVQLAARRVDAVVTDAFPGTQLTPVGGIEVRELGSDPVRGYVPAQVTNAEHLDGIPWVMEPADAPSTHWALRVTRERGIEPRIVHESSDMLFHLRMVEAGLAAAFLPDLVVREAHSDLEPSPLLPVERVRRILLLTRAGAGDQPALAAVGDAVSIALRQQVRKLNENA